MKILLLAVVLLAFAGFAGSGIAQHLAPNEPNAERLGFWCGAGGGVIVIVAGAVAWWGGGLHFTL